jgi:hypothetical protein
MTVSHSHLLEPLSRSIYIVVLEKQITLQEEGTTGAAAAHGSKNEKKGHRSKRDNLPRARVRERQLVRRPPGAVPQAPAQVLEDSE